MARTGTTRTGTPFEAIPVESGIGIAPAFAPIEGLGTEDETNRSSEERSWGSSESA